MSDKPCEMSDKPNDLEADKKFDLDFKERQLSKKLDFASGALLAQTVSICKIVRNLADAVEAEQEEKFELKNEFEAFKVKSSENQSEMMELTRTRFPEVWKLGQSLGWSE